MTNLIWQKKNNTAGVLKIEAAAVATIVTFPDITFKDGFGWLQVWGAMNSKGYDEQMDNTEHGQHRKVSVQLFYPFDDATIRDTLREMQFHQWVLRITGENGMKRLVGAPWNGLEFSYKFGTGDGISGKHGYTFEWTGDLVDKVPVVA